MTPVPASAEGPGRLAEGRRAAYGLGCLPWVGLVPLLKMAWCSGPGCQHMASVLVRSWWVWVEVPGQGRSSSPCQNRSCRLLWAEAEGTLGRVFPKNHDLDGLSFGHGTREHFVSNLERPVDRMGQGQLWVPRPALLYWAESGP